ncbi:MAG: glutamate-5-semialdehyde dehydrogenase [Clostridia bacterium]|nr:glutamate-5-semialdehyde dehydrogenase [Clostridia bacterium]
MTVRELCLRGREAIPALQSASGKQRNDALLAMAKLLMRDAELILEANKKDLSGAAENGVPAQMIDRLTLTESRLGAIASALEEVAALPDPLGLGEEWVRPNGLSIRRVTVPIGLIAMIYEARPNVTADAAALAVKSGNCVVLRGGKEAFFTNCAMVNSLREAMVSVGLPADCISMPEDPSRETATQLMQLRGVVDLLIPRGGKSLIRSVVDNASVPVIETGAGNCHVYVDASADVNMALSVVDNAKRQRPSVCNAAEGLVVHREIADTFLPLLRERLVDVEFRGCEETCKILPDCIPATEEDFYTEYNDLILHIKVVGGVEEAISFINAHNTGHSEAIMTESITNANRFTAGIDAAAVYVNASTRFTDGGEFGFGAEIGISTQKMHARGPMGLSALTTVKYVAWGNGQIRG